MTTFAQALHKGLGLTLTLVWIARTDARVSDLAGLLNATSLR